MCARLSPCCYVVRCAVSGSQGCQRKNFAWRICGCGRRVWQRVRACTTAVWAQSSPLPLASPLLSAPDPPVFSLSHCARWTALRSHAMSSILPCSPLAVDSSLSSSQPLVWLPDRTIMPAPPHPTATHTPSRYAPHHIMPAPSCTTQQEHHPQGEVLVTLKPYHCHTIVLCLLGRDCQLPR